MAHPHVKNVAQKSKMSQRGSRRDRRTYRRRDRRRWSRYQEPATCSRYSRPSAQTQTQADSSSEQQAAQKQSELNSKLAIPMRPFILFIPIVVVVAFVVVDEQTLGTNGRTDDRVFIFISVSIRVLFFFVLFLPLLFLFHFVFVNAVFFKLFHSIVCGAIDSLLSSPDPNRT